jgi:superoxide dismutase, Cu-Zn family
MIQRTLQRWAAVVALTGCSPGDGMIRVDLEPTQDHSAHGWLVLTQAGASVRIEGEVTGLDPRGTHGFHIHETGDCSDPDAEGAGSHLNPTGDVYGDPLGNRHHLGDMRNLEANAEGMAVVRQLIDDARLGVEGTHSLRGRAVIVRAEADDYTTDPSGDAGERIACGVIGPSSVLQSGL